MTDSNSKPKTHCGNLSRLPRALLPLTEQRHWVNWSWEQRDDKYTKPPKQPGNLRDARPNDPHTWSDYEHALRRWRDGDADGIGYMLLDAGIGAVDLDRCCRCNAETRKVRTEQWARELRDGANDAYCEITVSGSGQRLIGTAQGANLQRGFKQHGVGIELFRNTARYITVSGLELGNCSQLPPIDDFLDALRARYDSQREQPRKGREQRQRKAQRVPEQLMQLIREGVEAPRRSQRFMQVIGRLERLGWSVGEITALLEQYPDGIAAKYEGRLQREVERAYQRIGVDARKQPSNAWTLDTVRLADVEMRRVEWLWPLRIARDKLTIMAGDPGLGKSQIAVDIAARISSRSEWPDGERAPLGSVVILAAEDSADDTIRPRLEAAGGDSKRVHVVRMLTSAEGQRRGFDLHTDIERLAGLCERIGDVALIIIDPISAYMGDADSHMMTAVQPVLAAIADLAERCKVAVLAIHHPPKNAPSKAIHAFSGSLAFAAGPRLVFIVTEDANEDERKLLLPVKNNLGPLAAGLAYRVVFASVEHRISTSCIAWDDMPIEVSASEALRAANSSSREPERLSEAIEWLQAELANGAALVDEVQQSAAAAGISERTLKRAKQELGVVAEKEEGLFHGGKWKWRLP
jgi:hypothetical protein